MHHQFSPQRHLSPTPAGTWLLQGQKWGFWIPKLLFLLQHYDQSIHEKCLHLCESQYLTFFVSSLWCIQNGDGLKQDLTKYGQKFLIILWAAWTSFGQPTGWSGLGNLAILTWRCGIGGLEMRTWQLDLIIEQCGLSHLQSELEKQVK
jgi:hypothetical protein